MKNLLKNIWTAVKTLLAAMKQKFLVHPAQVVKVTVEQDVNTIKTDVATAKDAAEVAVTKVEDTATKVAADVHEGM